VRLPTFFRSIRFRLAFTYSVLVFTLAVAVVGVVNYALSRSLEAQSVSAGRQLTTIIDSETGQVITLEQDVQLQFVTLEQLVSRHAVDSLQSISFWVIVGLFPASVAIGWFVADRALRPIGAITAVAKDIQRTEDLTRRIDLEGPDDELKDLANTFDGMLDRIEDGMHARRAFVQDISHELRNPLAVMATNLDVVLSDADADLDEYMETARVVRRTVDRTARTVDELVVFARDEVPATRRVVVDLGSLLDEVIDEHRGPIEARRLTVERFGSAVTVAVDQTGVKRAVGNLVSNAVRLTSPGSTVRCGTGLMDGLAWVAVEDEGPGIDPRDHEHVFRRGWSGSGASIGGEGRSGLGLAITRQVAESHGGMVTLRSTLGEGAEFVLWLPAAPGADPGAVSGDGIHHLQALA
jgi:signal transduction histidine kinase